MFFPNKTLRLFDGSGPYLDASGFIWKGVTINDGLDIVEHAINAEASTLSMGVSGIGPDTANLAWQDTEAGDVIGSRVEILIQGCDQYDQPVGAPEIRFVGTIDNIMFDDTAQEETISSTVMIECSNRFGLRNLASGMVLSDADQKTRSAVLNPTASPDRIAERVPELMDKTIRWPVFRS